MFFPTIPFKISKNIKLPKTVLRGAKFAKHFAKKVARMTALTCPQFCRQKFAL